MNPNNQLAPPQPNPFHIEVPQPPHFRTTCELLRNLEIAWKLFQQVSIDPVFRSPSDDPFLDEDMKNSLFMELGSNTFTNICTKWATNEDLTFNIPQFFFDKLQAYVKKQCQALLLALQMEDDTVILDVTYQKSRKYWIIIKYLEEYFIYLESIQSDTHYDTEHEVDISKTRFMMSLTYKYEVFVPLSVRLRTIALDSLEMKRNGDSSTSYNVRMFERLINLVSISKGFTEGAWGFILRQSTFTALIVRLRFFHNHCLCYFIKEVALRMKEVEEYSVGTISPLFFQIMILPVVLFFFFEDKAKIIHLVKVEARNALKKLCDTFGQEEDIMRLIANIFENYVRETVIVKLKRSISENPEGTFIHFFFTWVKIVQLSVMNLDRSGYNEYVIDALTVPFYPIISEYEQILRPRLLAYFCKRVTKREEGVENFGKPVNVELEAGAVLLGNLRDSHGLLGIFMKRILMSLPREEYSRLHVEYLTTALITHSLFDPILSGLKGFFKLITNQEKNLADFSPNMSPWKLIPDPNRIPIQGVKAVQKNDWITCPGKIKVPGAMEQAVLSYSCFFHLKHRDKELEQCFSHDNVTVTTSLFSRGEEIDMHMTTHQMSILDLFQERDRLSVFQVIEGIQYWDKNDETPMDTRAQVPALLLRILRSLMNEPYPLLTKTPDSPLISMDDIISLNHQYFSPTKELILPIP